MTYATLAIARAQLLAFTPALRRAHNFVQCANGRWCLVLGAPAGCVHVHGRIWRVGAA